MISLSEIVFLDAFTTNPGDLSWEALSALGRFVKYDRTMADQFYERAGSADILITNKVPITRERVEKLGKLKLVCVAATGYNVVDIEACADHDIPVCNVAGYSSQSVAQHVFASLLSYLHQPLLYALDVRKNGWSDHKDFAYTWKPIQSLRGKTFGIYGFGNIGRQVARLADSFGMKVIAVNKHPERDPRPYVKNVNEWELFEQSDVISLHAPLNESSRQIVNSTSLKKMKKDAILINTARGGLIDEEALHNALTEGRIQAALLDVLEEEPPPRDHPLFRVKNCFITPHQAWINNQSRQTLIEGVAGNIRAFQEGTPLQNQVNFRR